MPKEQKEIWKTALGYCLKCWWKEPAEFHETVSEESIQKSAQLKHNKLNPHCPGTVRLEISIKK